MPLIRRPKVKWSVHYFCGKMSKDIFETEAGQSPRAVDYILPGTDSFN